MTVDELKLLLNVDKDKELADMLHRGATSVSNWRASGQVPANIVFKAQTLAHSIAGFNGDNNNFHMGDSHVPPELKVIQDMMKKWDEKRRKKLLRLALELDEDE